MNIDEAMEWAERLPSRQHDSAVKVLRREVLKLRRERVAITKEMVQAGADALERMPNGFISFKRWSRACLTAAMKQRRGRK